VILEDLTSARAVMIEPHDLSLDSDEWCYMRVDFKRVYFRRPCFCEGCYVAAT
jgi:hypothetical protein